MVVLTIPYSSFHLYIPTPNSSSESSSPHEKSLLHLELYIESYAVLMLFDQWLGRHGFSLSILVSSSQLRIRIRLALSIFGRNISSKRNASASIHIYTSMTQFLNKGMGRSADMALEPSPRSKDPERIASSAAVVLSFGGDHGDANHYNGRREAAANVCRRAALVSLVEGLDFTSLQQYGKAQWAGANHYVRRPTQGSANLNAPSCTCTNTR